MTRSTRTLVMTSGTTRLVVVVSFVNIAPWGKLDVRSKTPKVGKEGYNSHKTHGNIAKQERGVERKKKELR